MVRTDLSLGPGAAAAVTDPRGELRPMRTLGLVVALALGSVGGCRSPAPVAPTPALCVVRAGDRTPRAVAMRPDDWLGLLQCDLMHSRPDPRYDHCEEENSAWNLLPSRPMTGADVVVSILSRRERLVWLILRRTERGDGIGPVVLAEVDGPRAEVRAIGTLRARPENARMRLRRVGGATLLSAEGERCLTDSPASCVTWVRLMVKDGEHFVEMPLERDDGRCVSQAYFPMADESYTGLPIGWQRRFALSRSLRYDESLVTMHEQVVVTDSDPRVVETPPRPFRVVEADRTIRTHEGHLVVEQQSLWARVRTEQASVTDTDASVASSPDASHLR